MGRRHPRGARVATTASGGRSDRHCAVTVAAPATAGMRRAVIDMRLAQVLANANARTLRRWRWLGGFGEVRPMLGARAARYGYASMRVDAVLPRPTEASTVCWSFVAAQGRDEQSLKRCLVSARRHHNGDCTRAGNATDMTPAALTTAACFRKKACIALQRCRAVPRRGRCCQRPLQHAFEGRAVLRTLPSKWQRQLGLGPTPRGTRPPTSNARAGNGCAATGMARGIPRWDVQHATTE